MNTLNKLLKKVAIVPIRFCQIIARLTRKVSPTSKLTEIPNQKNDWQKVGYDFQKVGYDLEKSIHQYKIK